MKWIRGILSAGLLLAPALGAEANQGSARSGRHYDLRLTLAAGAAAAAEPARMAQLAQLARWAQDTAIARWRATTPGLVLDRDARTGALRALGNAGGYLSAPRQGADLANLAVDFVRQELDLFGLAVSDLDDYEITDVVPSRASGLSHIYLRQRFGGIPVYNGQLQVNITEDGRVLSVHNQFLPHLAAAVNRTEPETTVAEALASVAAHLQLGRADVLDSSPTARLMYLPIRAHEARLVWNFQVETAGSRHWYDVTVDATDGRVWTRVDWVAADSYKVYEIPVESPHYSVPPSPADGRTLAVNPAIAAASPFAWHDTDGAAGAEFTTTQGNNAHAYTDIDGDNLPDPGGSPDGGAALLFDFPLDLTAPPSTYRPASVTNLFYWNNMIHDVFHNYGFDEAAGNFQHNNYGNGGLGADSLQAEAQDGSGTNGANFFTPPDGARPRMQQFVGTLPNPDVDGAFDNLVITHEYGHGISNRLTGGPANVSCLGNAEQMGEGWSDFFGLVLTARESDTATTPRSIGTYLFGIGIRPEPYTTDMGVNGYGYGDLPSAAVPHGIGFIWATMLWEMYWALVGEYGFNSDIAGDWTTGGNNLALQLVVDGLKLQPCGPGFVDGRNAILAADTVLTGGANQCRIWGAFALRGLGFSAAQGSSGSTTDGTEAFDLPTSCPVDPMPFLDGFEDGSTDNWSGSVP